VRPAFLFDIDGTLIDSAAAVERVWHQVAAEFGVEPSAVLRGCHGRRDVDVVSEFFRPEDADAAVARVEELDLETVHGVIAVGGARALLRSLDPDRWAAVTSGRRALMTARLRAAGLPVPRVLVGADDVPAGKPDPSGFVMAAEALGVPPAECVVVEDSPAGVAAGRAAGALVVAVTTTHPADALAAADLVITDLAGLPAALQGGRERPGAPAR
jgi:sugar-phosphatase